MFKIKAVSKKHGKFNSFFHRTDENKELVSKGRLALLRVFNSSCKINENEGKKKNNRIIVEKPKQSNFNFHSKLLKNAL